jgi:hypothetical protein
MGQVVAEYLVWQSWAQFLATRGLHAIAVWTVTLTSVAPGHVAGSFTATFDDAGTISGGFDVDLCFDAELPECPYACVP